MRLIRMRALVPFTHEGARVRAGEPLEVGPVTAAALQYARQAEFVTVAVDPPPERKRRPYRRRDLQAES
jgi:hypothetical protein